MPFLVSLVVNTELWLLEVTENPGGVGTALVSSKTDIAPQIATMQGLRKTEKLATLAMSYGAGPNVLRAQAGHTFNKKTNRVFRTGALQTYQSRKNGSYAFRDSAEHLREWLIKNEMHGELYVSKTVNKFLKEHPQNGPLGTGAVYGPIHYGWKKGWWKIDDQAGYQCRFIFPKQEQPDVA